MKHLFRTLLASFAIAAASPAQAADILVFAAASLTESLKEIAAAYEKQSGDRVMFNFAASGPLARQIEEGAPADLFFSADEVKMDAVEKKRLITKETRRSLLSNILVVVVPTGSAIVMRSPKDLAAPSLQRLALGDPKTVPVGTYAKEYLTKLELWPSLEKKVVPCENVRAVLAAVESGNLDAGIVYKTDAAISGKVKIVFEVAAKEGPRIRYPVALVKASKQPVEAGRFLDYLGSTKAGEVFTRRGFILLPQETMKPNSRIQN